MAIYDDGRIRFVSRITSFGGDTPILTIDEVSDDKVINLFFIPHPKSSSIIESIQHEQDKDAECTHELLIERKNI